MSISVRRDGGEPCDLASNRGYGDFCRWIDALQGCPELKRLRETGVANGKLLTQELQGALTGVVAEDVEDVAKVLLYYSDCKEVSVTDGVE